MLAYELLTGTHPIDGDDYMDIMMKQLSFEPPPPSTLVPELPAAVDDAIAWLMRKDREQRPPSLAIAVRALEQAAGLPSAPQTGVVEVPKLVTPFPGSIISGPASLATTTSPSVATGLAQTQPGQPAPKRRRAPIVVGALCALGALGAIGAFALHGSPKPAAAPTHDDVAEPQPQAAPAAKPVAPAPQPPAATAAIVTVTGAPGGTDVSIAGTSIGVAPGQIQISRGASAVVLTFKANGYQPASRTITPDRDQALDVPLHKIRHAAPTAAQSADKDSILDPFGAKGGR